MAQVTSNSAVSSNALISASFKEANNATKASNNSVQQMAAGIMLFHAERHTSERATFDKMSERTEAFKLLKDELVNEFIVKRVTDKSKNAAGQQYTVDQVTKINRTNATQMVALNKGFDLAIALYALGVTSHNFDGKTALFNVPVSALLPRNEAGDIADPQGALKKVSSVSLDGTAYCAMLDEKLVRFNAFPAHLLTVAGYKRSTKAKLAGPAAVSGATNTSTTGGASAADIRADTATWSIEKAASEISKLALQISEVMDDQRHTFGFSQWPVELRNAVEGLLILRDEARQADDKSAVAA